MVNQVDVLYRIGKRVILVGSGAIALGRAGIQELIGTYILDQDCAFWGQRVLFNDWNEVFRQKGYKVREHLVVERDLVDDFQGNLLQEERQIDLINGDDTRQEIGAAGNNDYVANRIADIKRADVLVNLTNVDGVFNNGEVVRVINSEDCLENIEFWEKSLTGTGGMRQKLKYMLESAKKRTTFIACGEDKEVLFKILAGEVVGTRIRL